MWANTGFQQGEGSDTLCQSCQRIGTCVELYSLDVQSKWLRRNKYHELQSQYWSFPHYIMFAFSAASSDYIICCQFFFKI